MNAVEEDVKTLMKKELDAANATFPLFRSPHEGYAVIKEEYEECLQELEHVNSCLKFAWGNIKLNNDKYAEEWISKARKCAMNTAVEAIQTAAMCQKYLRSAWHWETE